MIIHNLLKIYKSWVYSSLSFFAFTKGIATIKAFIAAV